MSYILDAIAKSEQERQQQEVPGAQVLALPDSSVQQPRRILPYLVVGALLLNALMLVIWMQPDQASFSQSSPTQLENKDEQKGLDIKPVDTISTDPAISDHTELVGATVDTEGSDRVVEIDNSVSTNELPVKKQGMTPDKIGENTAALVNESDAVQSEMEPLATATGDGSSEWILISPDTLSSSIGSGRGVESVQGIQKTNNLSRKVSRISELPGAVRSDLPTVVFSGHLYSSDPESSVVFIDNGRPVMTGRQIANELFLHEITPSGVIVEFRGYLIEVGVLQNWTLN